MFRQAHRLPTSSPSGKHLSTHSPRHYQSSHGGPHLRRDMRRIDEWLRPRLTNHDPTDSDPGTEPALLNVRRSALRTLDDLAPDADAELCHGDLSLRNVLRHGQNCWMFVDPRGVSGEVELRHRGSEHQNRPAVAPYLARQAACRSCWSRARASTTMGRRCQRGARIAAQEQTPRTGSRQNCRRRHLYLTPRVAASRGISVPWAVPGRCLASLDPLRIWLS